MRERERERERVKVKKQLGKINWLIMKISSNSDTNRINIEKPLLKYKTIQIL
jgi:hypothetical protein